MLSCAILWLVSTCLGPLVPNQFTPSIYYSTLTNPGSGNIVRAELDGTNQEVIAHPSYNILGLEADTIHNKLYWSSVSPSTSVYRSDPDGSNVQLVYGNASQITNIKIDPIGEKLYWTDNILQRLYRANLDGSDAEPIITAQSAPPARSMSGLALDLQNSMLYWAEYSAIWRANLDGTNKQLFRHISSTSRLSALALDVEAGSIYWGGRDTLGVTNLTSGATQVLFDYPGTSGAFITDIELDLHNRKIYWTEQISRALRRADLDTFTIETLATGSDFAGLTVIPEPMTIALLSLGIAAIRPRTRSQFASSLKKDVSRIH
ncbi:hypothetical protein B7486_13195 [cyanobacterium TDX16]|nr:hypothetical protein B7486_13195 [cyanobacterium TDX16]